MIDIHGNYYDDDALITAGEARKMANQRVVEFVFGILVWIFVMCLVFNT